MDSVWLKLFCSFLLKPMRSQMPTPQWWHLWSLSVCSELTGACVPPEVPLVTKSLAWPAGGRWPQVVRGWTEQPRQPSPVSASPASSCHRARARLRDQLRARSRSCVRAPLLSSSLSLHPRYKATLEPGPSHPPPPGSPGSPRIFTFKSPIHRFAFKCFFSETSRLSDYLPTAGHQLISNSFSLIWENILLAALTILTGVGHCNTHHSDTPGWGSIQMVEDENKKSFNDFFDLQKNWKDENSVVKLN